MRELRLRRVRVQDFLLGDLSFGASLCAGVLLRDLSVQDVVVRGVRGRDLPLRGLIVKHVTRQYVRMRDSRISDACARDFFLSGVRLQDVRVRY